MSLSSLPFTRRYLPLALTLIAAGPLIGAVLWYQIGMLAAAQIGVLRVLGLLGVCWLLTSAVGGLLALGLAALRLEMRWRGWPWVGRVSLFAGSALSLAGLGLTVFYWSPSLAPLGARIAAAVVALTLIGAYVRYAEPYQRMLLKMLTGLGLTVIATPLVLSPWLVFDALSSRPPRVAAPPPERPLVKEDAPRRILLITFDGLRADSTSLHAPSLGTTPTLESMARSAAWFTEARAVSDSTLVSLPAIFTGTHPSLFIPHVQNEMRLVPEGLLTGIAGYLRRAGYRTLYATMFLTPGSIGLGSEFDTGSFASQYFIQSDFQSIDYLPLQETYDFLVRKLGRQPSSDVKQPGLHQVHGVRWTFQQALRMLESSHAPTFMWIHIGAPHMPYFEVPDLPAGAPLEPQRYRRIADRDFLTISHDPDGGTGRVRTAYEAYVRFADRELGQFVQGLKAAGLWEDSMLVLTSDHGENMSPPNFGHGVGPLTSDQTHVPLLMRLPGQQSERRVDELVSHLDILPTILSRVYQVSPEYLTGLSALDQPLPRNRSVVSHGWFFHDKRNRRYGPLSSAIYQQGLAYTVNTTNGRDSLVDLARRPLERRPEQISGLRAQVESYTGRFGPLPSHPPAFGAVGRMDPKPDTAR